MLPIVLLLLNSRWHVLIQNSDNHTRHKLLLPLDFAVDLASCPAANRRPAPWLHNVACGAALAALHEVSVYRICADVTRKVASAFKTDLRDNELLAAAAAAAAAAA